MDVEKTMQFILEQNAANTVQIAQLREMVLAHESDLKVHELDLKAHESDLKVHESDLDAHESALQAHTEWKLGMTQALQDLASQMKAGFATVAEKHAELAEMQKATQESLDILIRTVQDMIPRLPRE